MILGVYALYTTIAVANESAGPEDPSQKLSKGAHKDEHCTKHTLLCFS